MEVHTNSQGIEGIKPLILIITCESCRDVHYMDAVSEEEVADKFNRFQCKKGCERVYYSYITVAQIQLGSESGNPPTVIPITGRMASAGQ